MSTFLDGVEAPLPDGETILWQAKPARNTLALQAFHARKIALYFGALICLSAAFASNEAEPLKFFLSSAKWLALGASTACGFAFTVATLAARTSLYAITERRVVMKIGIALPVVLNIPLHIIDGVDVKRRADGSGDLALRLANKSRVAFAVLWPHARAWHVRYPQPLLRGLADIDAAGATLKQALLLANAGTVSDSPPAGRAVPELSGAAAKVPTPILATS